MDACANGGRVAAIERDAGPFRNWRSLAMNLFLASESLAPEKLSDLQRYSERLIAKGGLTLVLGACARPVAP